MMQIAKSNTQFKKEHIALSRLMYFITLILTLLLLNTTQLSAQDNQHSSQQSVFEPNDSSKQKDIKDNKNNTWSSSLPHIEINVSAAASALYIVIFNPWTFM